MKKYKKLLFLKHDEFDSAEQNNLRLLLRMEIRAIIEAIDEPDAQDFHILGLTYYDIESVDKADLVEAHRCFLKALDTDEKYHIARLYSAHCYHDKKEYAHALANYLLVDSKHIQQEYALWRHVKLLEQIGCCLHKLGKETEARDYFSSVLVHYQNSDYEDLVDPVEMYQCLEKGDDIRSKLSEIQRSYYEG